MCWYVVSFWQAYCVNDACERYAREIFKLAKRRNDGAVTLFRGIEVIEHFEPVS